MSTRSEPFSVLIFRDATKFLSLSVFTLIEKICLKFCSKSPFKSVKSPLSIDLRRSKTSLLKLRTGKECGDTFVACPEMFATWSELYGLISDV